MCDTLLITHVYNSRGSTVECRLAEVVWGTKAKSRFLAAAGDALRCVGTDAPVPESLPCDRGDCHCAATSASAASTPSRRQSFTLGAAGLPPYPPPLFLSTSLAALTALVVVVPARRRVVALRPR